MVPGQSGYARGDQLNSTHRLTVTGNRDRHLIRAELASCMRQLSSDEVLREAQTADRLKVIVDEMR